MEAEKTPLDISAPKNVSIRVFKIVRSMGSTLLEGRAQRRVAASIDERLVLPWDSACGSTRAAMR